MGKYNVNARLGNWQFTGGDGGGTAAALSVTQARVSQIAAEVKAWLADATAAEAGDFSPSRLLLAGAGHPLWLASKP